MNVVDLTQKLIGFDTVSAHSNGACVQFLDDHLRQLGFSTHLQDCSGADGVRKLNLIGRKGSGTGGLMLAGHSDTVPFRADQKATLTPFIEGGLLYGRGSCDMKGAIAAQLEAARATRDLPLRQPLTLAFTCDEEVGCLGAKRLLGTGLVTAAHTIVGEPTSLRPVRMHKGYVGLEVFLRGLAAHSSEPARGRSAIVAAARAINALEALSAQLGGRGYAADPDAFKPDCCTLNVGVIRGGVARNVIPEVCQFTVELRPLPGQVPADLIGQVRSAVEEAVAPLGVEARFDVRTSDAAMETPASAEVLAFLTERAGGAKPGSISFSTEGKEYNQMGSSSAIFGPGSITKAHQEDEYVPLDELESSVDHYRAAIEHFCL